jgi:hypothetical protein
MRKQQEMHLEGPEEHLCSKVVEPCLSILVQVISWLEMLNFKYPPTHHGLL